MKRLILTALAAAALLALAVSVSLAYTSTGTGFPLIVFDDGGGDQSDPHVSGRYATYTDAQTDSVGIKYFDFATQTTGSVPNVAGTLDSLSDISGATIVFTRVDLSTGASAIYSYLIGGTPAEVAPVAPPALPSRRNPAIGGSTIAWEDSAVSADANPELVVDSAGTVTQLTRRTGRPERERFTGWVDRRLGEVRGLV